MINNIVENLALIASCDPCSWPHQIG